MSSRRPLVMLIALSTLMAGVAAFNYAVNPFGAWRNHLVDPIYRSLEHPRITIPYLVRVADPRIMILGDSRAELGIPIVQTYRDGFFNAAMLGARLNEISTLLEPVLRNPRLKLIIWQLDFFSFGQLSETVYDAPTLVRLAHPDRKICGDTLLSIDALNDSVDMLERSARGRGALPVYAVAPLPWPQDVIRQEAGEPSKSPFFGSDANVALYLSGLTASLYQPFQYSSHQVELFREMVARIHRAGVSLIVFLPPLSEHELELIRLAGKADDFMRFKADIASIAAYTDFSGYNAMAQADFLYRDPMHFKPALGWAIMRRLLGLDCSQCGPVAGLVAASETKWDPRNAASNLEAARSDMTMATRTPSKYSVAATMALEQYAARPAESALGQ